MRIFFLEILKKLLVAILFALVMFVGSYSLVTGEFPPKIADMKRGVQSLQLQVQSIRKIQEAKLAQSLLAMDIEQNTPTNAQPEVKVYTNTSDSQQALIKKIAELEARLSRIEERINQNY